MPGLARSPNIVATFILISDALFADELFSVVWDPSREPILFFDQSAVLHAMWYNIQIQIHRPFIVPKGTPISSSSLAICRSAARSCARVLDTQREKGRLMMFGFTVSAGKAFPT